MEERIVAADPVADPQGYRRELLALLGDDDPGEVLAETLRAFQERAGDLPAELVERRPEPGEWSVAELLAHLWDAELVYGFRARSILTQDRPQLAAFDQEAWATLPRPPFAELLTGFAALRAGNLALIRGTPAERWARAGVHQERGETSFSVLTQEIAGHARAHLLQLEQTVAAVRRGYA
jgi:DinB superfamily